MKKQSLKECKDCQNELRTCKKNEAGVTEKWSTKTYETACILSKEESLDCEGDPAAIIVIMFTDRYSEK